VAQVSNNLNTPTSHSFANSNNVNPLINPNGSTDLDWIVNAVADIQKPKPKFEIEQQPVTYDELEKWNEIIDRRWSMCATKKFVKTCSINGDRHFLRINYNRCNDRKLCPRCAWYNARSEAWTTWYWLKTNIVTSMPFKVYFTHLVFTLPKGMEISDKKLVSAVDKVMTHQNENCKTTYCYVIQNNSSTNPLRKHRHVHVLSLNIGMMNGVLSDRKQFRRLRPFFNVDRLRASWSKAIGYNKQVDLHVNYCSFFNKGQSIHWLSYMYRYQVWDSFKFLIRGGGNRGAVGPPVYLDKLDGSTLTALLSQQKKRVTWKGFLSATKRRKTVEQLGEFYTMRDIRQKVRADSRKCQYKDEYGHVCGALLIVIDEISAEVDKVLAVAVNTYERKGSSSSS